MTRRSPRRTLAVLVAASMATAALVVTFTGSASADAPRITRSQVATPPPPGSGVQITVGEIAVGGIVVEREPQPLGPLSFT